MSKITVQYIDHMGSDLSVVRAARVSFADDLEQTVYTRIYDEDEQGKYTKLIEVLAEKDHKLIAYLAKHNHWTPFAHTSITLRVSAPAPIRTQCFKHKQGFVENEDSRRYIKSTPELYVPEVWRKAPPEGSAKQGSGGVHPMSDYWRRQYVAKARESIDCYEAMVENGVCPEQARFVLPQGCIVNWYWTGSLAAYARVYKQRTDPHAQKEIQDLAKTIGSRIEPLFPVSWTELIK